MPNRNGMGPEGRGPGTGRGLGGCVPTARDAAPPVTGAGQGWGRGRGRGAGCGGGGQRRRLGWGQNWGGGVADSNLSEQVRRLEDTVARLESDLSGRAHTEGPTK